MEEINYKDWIKKIELEYRKQIKTEDKISLNEFKATALAQIRWQFSLGYNKDEITIGKLPDNKPKAILKITSYMDNVRRFYEVQPFFYDKSKIFWFWNKKEYRYEIVDEVDVMSAIDNELGFGGDTVTGNIKCNYLEAFKRVGREKHPKEAPVKWIQFKNKAFSLKSDNIYKVKPNYFFTNPIPWELGDSDETPTMDKLFEEWVGERNIKTLYEIIAYCCYRDYPLHFAFCLIGSGRNGKSQFQKIIYKFFGENNIASSELDVISDNRFESFKLYKKLACVMSETNFGVMERSSMFKKLTGGDLIGFEKKRCDPFNDFSYATLLINSNSMPISEDTSEGFYRRWFIIDFPNEFPEGKDIVSTIPNKEYNCLARKVVQILPRLLKEGQFTNQGTIEQRKQAYIYASNPLSFFIGQCCDVDSGMYIRFGELYVAYCTYLNKNKKRVVSTREFTVALTNLGFEKRRTSKDGESSNYVEGVSLKQNWLKNVRNVANVGVYPLTPYRRDKVDIPTFATFATLNKEAEMVIDNIVPTKDRIKEE